MSTKTEKAVLTSNGIKEFLKSYKWEQAICEYIWNGFDAGATEICLDYESGGELFSGLTSLKISDNGRGISKQSLKNHFRPINESAKAVNNSEPRNHSLPHGKSGKGRLTFFTFAQLATWRTTCKEGDTLFTQEITINADAVDSYNPVDIDKPDSDCGTTVTFTGTHRLTTEGINCELIPHLKREFAWFLELYKAKGFSIKINGRALDYCDMIQDRCSLVVNEEDQEKRFSVSFVLWKERLHAEYSKYYYLKEDGSEAWKENTTLNNKGDNFYHSVYIQGPFFNQFYWNVIDPNGQTEMQNNRSHETFKDLAEKLSKLLHEKRNPFIDAYTKSLIREYEKEALFPDHGASITAQYQNQVIRETVRELYKVEPKVFTSLNVIQKRTFIGLLDAMIDLGADDRLMEIISKVVEMTPHERSQLAHVLEYASLSGITKVISMVKDRFKVVEQLKEIVFNRKWDGAEADIQAIVERHFWLFGEQYNLVTAEEPKFEEALRRYLHLLSGDGVTRNPKIKSIHKDKEMDVFACRRDVRNNSIQNIVVELKHPDVKLGQTELNQITLYSGVILGESEFTAQNASWNFILVGRDFDTSKSIENALESAGIYGERFLVRNNPSVRSKTYVMRWSDVFTEFECRHNCILEKLELDKERIIKDIEESKSAKEIAADAATNSAAETADWENPRDPIGAQDQLSLSAAQPNQSLIPN